ncbi:MAG TPA: PorT family protein, partial [Candidatus Avibacteroides excrementipullorum]|nr:PorT family protein [Candidatus Avibacteroides excrementipullorum]
MKRIITTAITIACLVFSMNIQAQEKPKKINWGMKCGFNSSMFFIKQLLLN